MNYCLDIEQIKKIASNSNVYNAGVREFKEGHVERIIFYSTGMSQTVSAQVKNAYEDASCQVMLYFENNGNLKKHTCECRSHIVWRGACKHVVALLLELNSKGLKKSGDSPNVRLARKMLDYFEERALKDLDLSDLTVVDGRVSVVPLVNIFRNAISYNGEQDENYQKPFLSLSVGAERQYIVKDIAAFIRNIKNEGIISYGKNFSFKHTLSAFDELGAELVNLIMREHEETGLIWRHNRASDMPFSMENKVMPMNARVCDRFFELYMDRSIEYKIFEYSATLSNSATVKNANLPFKIGLEQKEKTIEIFPVTVIQNKLTALKGELFSYALYENCFYKIEHEQYRLISAVILAMKEAPDNKLIISGKEIARFMTYLYPHLRDGGFLQDDNIHEVVGFNFDPLVKKLYFDADKQGILCKALFCYGKVEIDPVFDRVINNETIFRNRPEEHNLLKTLMKFGFEPDKKRECFVLKDDDLIYDFYYSPFGLEMLRKQNEVYATDDFTNKSVKRKIKASFGVRLQGGLLEVSVDCNYNLDELLDIMNSYGLRKKYHKLDDGTIVGFDDNDENLEQASKLLSGLGLSERDIKKSKDGIIDVPHYRAVYINNLLKENGMHVNMDESVKKISGDFAGYKEIDFSIPSTLQDVLRQYQKEGFNWLNVISKYGFGGILADDMGLGKTLQIISILLSKKKNDSANIANSNINEVSEQQNSDPQSGEFQNNELQNSELQNSELQNSKPSIVVAPTSLIYNWEKEIKRFAPELKVMPIIGTPVKRAELLSDGTTAEVYITTYDILKKDIENYEKIDFEYIVADEAQNIKNPATQNAKALKNLKGRVRYALTGTPIENSLSELWSIFDFIMPGYLYSNHSKFSKEYEVPIMKNNDEEKSLALRKQIAPFILRRLKADVLLELPEKIETTLYAEMTDEQKKLYAAYLLEAKGVLDESIGSGAFNSRRIDILAQLTRLRQICCHPSVFINSYTGGSGKLDLTMERISDLLESGHRVLLFSQFTSMLRIIRDRLDAENIEYFYLDGSTDSKKRLYMADSFNSGIGRVFLVSLKAGGTGLNITGADVVIHYDQWWNPAVMNQAADRAHRFGQKRVVQVINIVAKDSIEEKILELQSKKKDLVDSVINDGSNYMNTMSLEEIVSLFN